MKLLYGHRLSSFVRLSCLKWFPPGEKYLPAGLWEKIEATFSGSNIEENWNALFAYADLAHLLGVELSEKLGYSYPTKLEKGIRKYLEDVRSKQ